MLTYLIIFSHVFASDAFNSARAEQAFGNAQVEQIILDRPDLGEIIKHDQALRNLLVSSFAGGLEDKQRIYWDYREPDINEPAESIPQYGEYHSSVRVARVSASSAIDRIAMLVLELNNNYFGRRSEALTRMVQSHQITRNDYARSCIHLEYDSSLRTRDYFRKHPLTESDPNANPWYHDVLNTPTDFGTYLASEETTDEDSLFTFYQKQYDGIAR